MIELVSYLLKNHKPDSVVEMNYNNIIRELDAIPWYVIKKLGEAKAIDDIEERKIGDETIFIACFPYGNSGIFFRYERCPEVNGLPPHGFSNLSKVRYGSEFGYLEEGDEFDIPIAMRFHKEDRTDVINSLDNNKLNFLRHLTEDLKKAYIMS